MKFDIKVTLLHGHYPPPEVSRGEIRDALYDSFNERLDWMVDQVQALLDAKITEEH